MAHDPIRQQVSGSTFFSGLAPELLDFLAQHAKPRQLAPGEVLFRYGDHADRFFLISGGHAGVEVAAIEGPALELEDLGPGAVVGWSWLIAPHRWSFQARAKTAVDLLEFDGAAVLRLCEKNHEFAYELLKRFSALMSERLHFARQKMMEEWSARGYA